MESVAERTIKEMGQVVEVSPPAQYDMLIFESTNQTSQMIRILFFLSSLTILACNSNSKPVTETAETNASSKSLSTPVPFGGSWISASYLNDIKEHQSPSSGLRHGTRNAVEADIVDTKGNMLGKHQGTWNYTLGQRKGLGIAHSEPLYVVRLEAATNTVIVGTRRSI